MRDSECRRITETEINAGNPVNSRYSFRFIKCNTQLGTHLSKQEVILGVSNTFAKSLTTNYHMPPPSNNLEIFRPNQCT